MEAAGRELRRMFAISATFALAAAVLAVAPGADAVANTCRARNVTKDTAVRSNLQRVIDAASPGDRIAVKYVCVGNFTISKDLTLVGKPSPGVPRPVLHADGSGRPLLVKASVTLSNLKVTGGDVHVRGYGGGVLTQGGSTLTLKNVVVRGNKAYEGGGIYNNGTLLTLNGSSSVSGNTARMGGGIYSWRGTLTLNGSSSVSGNTARDGGGGIYAPTGGTLTLNGSSSVSGNTAGTGGGGILNNGTMTLKDSSSVTGNTAPEPGDGGGIYTLIGTVNACDGTGADEWIGTVEPNTPNDFLDGDVTLITCT